MNRDGLLGVVAARPRWRVERLPGELAETPDGLSSSKVLLRVDRDRLSGSVEIEERPDGGWSAHYYRTHFDYHHEVRMASRPMFAVYHDDNPYSVHDRSPHFFRFETVEELDGVLREIELRRDERVLGDSSAGGLRERLVAAFRDCVAAAGLPWESGGSLDVPGGEYVQWTRTEEGPSPLHVEVSDGGDYSTPMEATVVAVLVGLGWSAPDETFRNCWTRADDAELVRAADLVLLTLVVGLGVDALGIGSLRIITPDGESET